MKLDNNDFENMLDNIHSVIYHDIYKDDFPSVYREIIMKETDSILQNIRGDVGAYLHYQETHSYAEIMQIIRDNIFKKIKGDHVGKDIKNDAIHTDKIMSKIEDKLSYLKEMEP